MARFVKKKHLTIGQTPGEIIFIGDKKMDSPTIKVFDYDMDQFVEKEISDINECFGFLGTKTVTWININGLHDTELIKQIGEGFSLHPLILEDIANTGQRPKMEEFDDYLFFVMKMMRYDSDLKKVVTEQLSLIIGANFLITFQEIPGDVFNHIRERIRKNRGRIRKSGPDYLGYSLIDTIIDNYLLIIERLGEEIEDVENVIIRSKDPMILNTINRYKREMNYLRKTVRPVKEFLLLFSKTESDLVEEGTYPFLKDLLDLSTQTVEIIDSYRDMLSDQLNIYNTQISNKLNEIMKVLTIFSAIFIPLTFIAGIYGTNFEYLPELKYKYSYFIFWGVLIIITLIMVRYFKRKNWL